MGVKDIQWGFYIPKGQERESIQTLESWLSKAEWVKAYSFSFEAEESEQRAPVSEQREAAASLRSTADHRLLRILLLVQDDFDLDLALDLIKMWIESENDSDLKMLPETKPKNYD